MIISQQHADFIYYISHTSIISSIYAIINGHYDLAFVPGFIYLTSINYWKNPVFGFRRNLDITCVFTTLSYQLYRSINSENFMLYLFVKLIAMISFPISWYFVDKDFELSMLFHGFVHLFGNISNIILYSGSV
jgi:hypothetical protein